MGFLGTTSSKSKIELDTDGLSAQHIRLLKTLNHVVKLTMTTEYEDEFFESSAEFIKTWASLIKQSDFAERNEGFYADQALEYAADILEENISKKSAVNYDN
ncbi:hypothetical protein OAK75_06555 [Bacteriovoracales bacterium]|nr:hypothetical protein [Bacteriovoracales bacterium]